MKKTAVALVSGGLDSTTMAYLLASEGYEVTFLSVLYGQRHKKELEFAKYHADRLGADYIEVDLSSIVPHLTGSALTDDIDVPEGHYAEENMRVTVVPNRNAMMLSVAFAIAAAKGLQDVATAVHGGDHAIYADCRPEFIRAFRKMELVSLNKSSYVDWVELIAPFLYWTKADIAERAGGLGFAIDKTWSCYKGTEIHCGRCATCVERQEALHLAKVPDPTKYMDGDYWKTVVSGANGAEVK